MAATIEPKTIYPSNIKPTMRAMMLSQCSAFYWGPPGIGKSEIAMDFANDLGIAFCDVRLSQREPTDVRGMPVPVKENGLIVGVVWIAPSEFPLDVDQTFYRDVEAIDMTISFKRLNPTGLNGIHHIPDPQITVRSINRKLEAIVANQTLTDFTVQLVDKAEAEAVRAKGGSLDDLLALEPHAGRIEYRIVGKAKAVLAFEEMNSGQPMVLAACYQIIHDRVIADQHLNDDILIIAMGNNENDRGVAFQMPEPLLNRMIHYNVKHSTKDWINWAQKSQQEPSTVAYIQRFGQKLFDHKPGSGAKGFATPRSWTRVSKVLLALAANPRVDLTEDELRATIYGSIGDGVGAEFFEFRKIAEKLPTSDDVLSGRVKKLGDCEADRTAIGHLITNSVLYSLLNEDGALQAKGIDETSKSKERREWYDRVDNYIVFALTNFKADINVMGIRAALNNLGLPINGKDCARWASFVGKYKDLLIDTYK